MDATGARTDVAVVGGGLGGLVAALTAARAAGRRRVDLFDPHPLGGRARCDERNGFTFNRGPRALYIGGAADRVLTDLGIDTSAGGPPHVEGSGVIDRGEVHAMPHSPATAMRTTLMSPSEKFAFARAFTKVPRIDPASVVGLTVSEWLDSLKLHGAPRRMLEALIRVATYTDAPDLFDAGAALANAQAGMSPGVRYVDGGWQTFVDALAAAAWDAGVIRHEVGVASIGRSAGDEAIALSLDDGSNVVASSAVVAVGGPDAAAALLGGAPREWSRLGPPVTAGCLELGLRRVPDRRFLLGVGEPTYLSTHAPPAGLAPVGHAVVHVMRYQRPGDDMAAADQRAILDRLAADAGITPADVVTERYLARMPVTGGLPTAAGGGLAGRPSIEVPGRPGVLIAGDWVGDKGLLLDAVAASASEAGRLAAARCATMAAA
jgi:phytoene dehydrogenase-like protein